MLHLFSLLIILVQQSGKFGIIGPVAFSLTFPKSATQTEDYKITSMDGEFTMEVSRDKQEVKVLLLFRDASQYNHALIEKADDVKNEFRQCGYVDLKSDPTPDGRVEKKDKYPRMYSASFYRIRTVSKEGIERTYPAVRLPAKTQ